MLTHIKQIIGLQSELNSKFNTTGGTISGDTTIVGNIDADTISYSGTDLYDIFTTGSGKSISKLFEGVCTQASETVKVTTSYKDIPLDYVIIKDDYYSHSASTGSTGSEIVFLNSGWYEFNLSIMVKTDSASAGVRGNPTMNVWFDTGGGWVAQPNQAGGYIREDASNDLSATITTIGLKYVSGGTKFKMTIRDTVSTPPDESVVPYSTRTIIKYIDRTGTISGDTIENLKDIGDVNANAPNDGDTIIFNGLTSKWDSGVATEEKQHFISIDSGNDLGLAGIAYFGNTGMSFFSFPNSLRATV